MTDPQRVNIGKQHPAAYKTLIALSSQVKRPPPQRASTRSWSNC
ncbi:hypothetical protein [Streptomyces mirabilis]